MPDKDRMPAYNLSDFISACRDAKSVRISEGAFATAQADFGFRTRADVFDRIGNGFLEKPTHENTQIWENNRDKNTPTMCDSYGFFTGPKHGYLKFVFIAHTKIWMITSLKANDRTDKGDQRNLPFAAALAQLKLEPKKEGEK